MSSLPMLLSPLNFPLSFFSDVNETDNLDMSLIIGQPLAMSFSSGSTLDFYAQWFLTLFKERALKFKLSFPCFFRVPFPSPRELTTKINQYFNLLRERLPDTSHPMELFIHLCQLEEKNPFSVDSLIEEFLLLHLIHTRHRPCQSAIRATLEYLVLSKSGYSAECACCGEMAVYHDLHKPCLEPLQQIGDELFDKIWQHADRPSPLLPKCFCLRCTTSIRHNNLPRRSRYNGFRSTFVPRVVRQLNPIEAQFVSPCLAFFTMVRDSHITQFKIHGPVVSIPIQPDRTFVHLLPRINANSHVFELQIVKRSLNDHQERPFLRGMLRANRLFQSLEHLVTTTEYRANNIQIDRELAAHFNDLNFNGSRVDDDTTPNIPPFLRYIRGGADDLQQFSAVMSPWDWDASQIIPFKRIRGDITETVDFNSRSAEPIYRRHEDRRYTPEMMFVTCFGGEPRVEFEIEDVRIKEIYQNEALRSDFQHQFCPKILWDCLDYLHQVLDACKNTILLQVADHLLLSQLHRLQRTLLARIRSSPHYWERQQKDLMSMLIQLGIPTYFVTVSPNEKEWVDILRALWYSECKRLDCPLTNPPDDYLLQLPLKDKNSLIANNPVVAFQMVYKRFERLFKVITNQDGILFGEVQDHYYRIEFQMRGSAHFHLLFWIKDAPTFEDNIDDLTQLIQYIDRNVTCSYVNETEEMKRKLTCQIHSHTRTCWREAKCRFHYPIPPSPSTRFIDPIIPSTLSPEELVNAQEDYKEKIVATLAEIHTGSTISFEEFLELTRLSEERYFYVLQVCYIRTKSILYRRLPGEKNINKYNRRVFDLWQGNMDIGFVIDGSACVRYIVNYLTKSFRELSLTLKEYIKNMDLSNRSANSILSSLKLKLLTAGQLGIQEAVCYILFKNMSVKSRRVMSIYVPSLTHIFNSRLASAIADEEERERFNLENPSADNFTPTAAVSHYMQRNNNLEHVCVFRYHQAFYYKNQTSEGPFRFPQNNGVGYSLLRQDEKKYAIIRWLPFDPEHFPRNATYQNIYLFSSFREIPVVHSDEELTVLYNLRRTEIEHNQRVCGVHEHRLILDFNTAFEEFRATAQFIPRNPQQTAVVYDAAHTQQHLQAAQRQHNIGRVNYHTLMMSQSPEQLRLVYDLGFRLYHDINVPFQVFIEGPGGAGKSHLIQALSQFTTHLLDHSSSSSPPNDPVILRIAPTGVAAVNIHGMTIHSAFHIPIENSNATTVYQNPQRHDNIQQRLQHLSSVKLIIIDEISAVADWLFSEIDHKLRMIHPLQRTILFGGVSVVIVGDLYQLPPVRAKMVCHPESVCTDIWRQFRRYRLVSNMRQRNDPEFFAVLEELRVGQLSRQSYQYLDQRVVTLEQLHEIRRRPPAETRVTEICFTNRDVTDINMQCIQSQGTMDVVYCPARDSIAGPSRTSEREAREMLLTALYKDTAKLMSNLPLLKNFPYVLAYNIDVEDSIANGTEVELVFIDMALQLGTDESYVLWVVPLHSQVAGCSARRNCHYVPDEVLLIPTAFPILTVQQSFYINACIVRRRQFPLVPAYGTTVHRAQSRSMARIVAHTNYITISEFGVQRRKNVGPDHLYVQCSRPSSGQDLMLYPKMPRISQNDRQAALAATLASMPTYQFTLQQHRRRHTFISVGFHNGQGCGNRLNRYSADAFYNSLDVLCLVETHSSIAVDALPVFQLCCQVPGQGRNGTGLAVFIKVGSESTVFLCDRVLEGAMSVEVAVLRLGGSMFVFLYANPRTTSTFLSVVLSQVFRQFLSSWEGKVYCFGDFNQSMKSVTFPQFLQGLGLAIYETEFSTHRSGAKLNRVLANTPVTLHSYPSYFSDHDCIWSYIAQA